MNVSLTYSKLSLHHLAALGAACSHNVALFENNDKDNNLSMGPHCDKIRSQNSIICLILNFDPIEENVCAPLLYEAKYIKPYLYNLYRNLSANKPEKVRIVTIQNVLDKIADQFGDQLKARITPLELVLWADLYVLFSSKSPFLHHDIMLKVVLPASLRNWFDKIDELVPLRRAARISFGDDEMSALTIAVKNLPCLPSHALLFDNDNVPLTNNIAKLTFLNGHVDVEPPKSFNTPKLPLQNTRNILITSALPYVNNVPHLGNLIGSTLSADIFSRYCRARGYNSLYVCGTDEYGTATEVKALAEKLSPKEICDRYHAIHKEVYDWFEIDFDVFGRTSDKEHAQLVTEVFEDIYRHGYIMKDSVNQLFCESCDRFLADRFVEGGCITCGYDDARGDQCDKCGKLINAVELVKPRCKLCSSSPCIRTSNHLFLDLTKIQNELETFLTTTMNSSDSIWTTNAKSITKAWLGEGLKPRCISRDLKWGVPVPLEGFQNKVFYVWFDAVLGYMSITAGYTDAWRQWWLTEEVEESRGAEVELYMFMAKDNVPFHSVILPANLLATGRRYTLLRQLLATEYLNYENDKFSKSRGVGVFGLDAKDSGISADLWRFYLVCCRPETQDSSFLWDDFAARNNSELLNNLGNFVNRALAFLVNFFQGTVQQLDLLLEADCDFIDEINVQLKNYVHCMEQARMREALAAILTISRLGNGYMQRNTPWISVKDSVTRPRAGTVVSVAANIVVTLGVILSPIMPKVGEKILEQCKAPLKSRQILDDCMLRAFLQPGHKIGTVAPLFQKMEPDFILEMKKKFGSSS